MSHRLGIALAIVTLGALALGGQPGAGASGGTEVVVSDPVVSISPTSVVEGTAPLPDGKQYTIMTFAIHLSAATNQPVTVVAQTGTGSAVVKRDFKARYRTVTIAAGKRKGLFTVRIVPDAIPEANEEFHAVLSAPTNATLGNSSAAGTIIDDDGGS